MRLVLSRLRHALHGNHYGYSAGERQIFSLDLIKSARFLKSQLLNFVVFGIAITSVVMSSAAMATAPTVTIGVTPNQTTIAAGPNGASVYVTGTFSSTSSVSYIRILNGTTELGIAFWGGGDSYGFAWNNVPTGTYSLTAEATDATGAIGTSSPITITVIPDVAPTATINTPVANASFSAGPDGALIYVFGTFSSSTSSVNLIRIYNGTTLLGNGFWGGGDSYGFEWRGVPAGTYNLIAQATDAAGLTGSSAPVRCSECASDSEHIVPAEQQHFFRWIKWSIDSNHRKRRFF
jgi:hypothetical protein